MLQPLLTDNLGLSLKSRYQKKKVWSTRINYPSSLSFTNPKRKPLKEKKIHSLPWCKRQVLHFPYVSLLRALPSVLFDASMLTVLSCKFLYYSKSTFFFSQIQVRSRYRQRKCLLCILGTFQSGFLPSHSLHLSHQLCTCNLHCGQCYSSRGNLDK